MDAEIKKLRQLEKEVIENRAQSNILRGTIDRQKRIISDICANSGGHKWTKKPCSGGMRDNNEFDYVCEICGLE